MREAPRLADGMDATNEAAQPEPRFLIFQLRCVAALATEQGEAKAFVPEQGLPVESQPLTASQNSLPLQNRPSSGQLPSLAVFVQLPSP